LLAISFCHAESQCIAAAGDYPLLRDTFHLDFGRSADSFTSTFTGIAVAAAGGLYTIGITNRISWRLAWHHADRVW